MATGLASWSQTAASNNTADSNVNWQEGQAPSTVNDSARAMMASMAKWRDDNAGALTTGGTSTAYTVSSYQGFATLAAMNGQSLRLTFNATNGAAPTLNVDSLGAKAIVNQSGAAIGSGDIVANSVVSLVYDNANTVWVVVGGRSEFPVGTLMLFQQTAAPTGWTKQATHNDKALRVVSGTASSGGSTAFSTIMAARTIAQANLPNVNFTVTIPAGQGNHSHTTNSGTAENVGSSAANYTAGATPSVPTLAVQISIDASTLPQMTGTAASGGSGTALDFAVQYVDLIICAKS